VKPAPSDLDAPCACSAQRRPYELPHDGDCAWRPMTAAAPPDAMAARVDAAIEAARDERATLGPVEATPATEVAQAQSTPAKRSNGHTPMPFAAVQPAVAAAHAKAMASPGEAFPVVDAEGKTRMLVSVGDEPAPVPAVEPSSRDAPRRAPEVSGIQHHDMMNPDEPRRGKHARMRAQRDAAVARAEAAERELDEREIALSQSRERVDEVLQLHAELTEAVSAVLLSRDQRTLAALDRVYRQQREAGAGEPSAAHPPRSPYSDTTTQLTDDLLDRARERAAAARKVQDDEARCLAAQPAPRAVSEGVRLGEPDLRALTSAWRDFKRETAEMQAHLEEALRDAGALKGGE
jgi:hypothetical protein